MRDGQPSATARAVAAARLGFERVPFGAGDPAADEQLARDVAGELAGADPGPLSRYLAARTAFFDRVVVSALGAGTTQIVVVGAGYDGRALRYRAPGVIWYEVDHPATQADKRERLERLGIPTDRISFVPLDLTTAPLPPALAGAGHDPTVESLFVCEGLLVYLDRAVIDRLLSGLRAVAAPQSRLALSASVDRPGEAPPAHRAAFSARVAALGEPALTVLPSADAVALLERAGWTPGDSPASDGRRSAGLITATAT